MAREAAARRAFHFVDTKLASRAYPCLGRAVFSEEGRAVEEELGRIPLQAPPTVSPYMEYP